MVLAQTRFLEGVGHKAPMSALGQKRTFAVH